jgi:hypothetical protein
MNKPTSSKKTSKPSKSGPVENARMRINALVEDPVESQLAEAKNGINYDDSSLEATPVKTASVESLVFLPVRTVKPTEIADELTSPANRKMIGKLRRAFRKAGKSEASETEIRAFLTSLLEAKVPVLDRSSGRICRVIKGEQSIESLLLVRVPKKSA